MGEHAIVVNMQGGMKDRRKALNPDAHRTDTPGAVASTTNLFT